MKKIPGVVVFVVLSGDTLTPFLLLSLQQLLIFLKLLQAPQALLPLLLELLQTVLLLALLQLGLFLLDDFARARVQVAQELLNVL